jgi:hypothetical protein
MYRRAVSKSLSIIRNTCYYLHNYTPRNEGGGILESECPCKTNTLPILMHQMRISTTQVSSVMLGPIKYEIRKKM